MKRFLLLFMLIVSLTVGLAFAARAKKMSVQVQESYLRLKPSYYGKVVTTVKYADRLLVNEAKGGWVKASLNGKSGWIHKSALTKKTLKLASGKAVSGSVSSDELSAAEKGFTKQIEAEYRKKNKKIDFTWVDKMEKIKVSPKQSAAFLKQGKITPAEGGAK